MQGAGGYCAKQAWGSGEPVPQVFAHGDLGARQVFVENGRLSGIIDWGDAMVTDRHHELIQLYRDMFDCDKALLRVFLEASDWPRPRRCARSPRDFGRRRRSARTGSAPSAERCAARPRLGKSTRHS
ncbi:MAG: phosphotransferase [Chloroflexi bacterium]|nr:phosphotransferase [Chloroflexota bacterium]